MDDKVSRRWQCKALDMYDRRLHEILPDRRASECRSGESMREKQINHLHANTGVRKSISDSRTMHWLTQVEIL